MEFSFTLLDQATQAGANVRVTPYALRVGANGQLFQSVKARMPHAASSVCGSPDAAGTVMSLLAAQIVPFLAAFAQTTKQQLASQAALALNATAGLLQGDFAPAAAFAQATDMIISMQASPVPTVLTLRRGGRPR